MSKRMLIDASHPEETRVVVLDGQKVEEFDFEAATKLPLKGNIYLAKITRVEPSLQAAFVEYGGNRQGFLAFSEIHPDYYQIPIADRQALLAEQEEEARRQAEREDAEDDAASEAAAAASSTTEDGAEGQSPIAELVAAEEQSLTNETATLEGGDVMAADDGTRPAASGETDNGEDDGEDDDYFPPPDRAAEPDEDPHAHLAEDDDEHEHRHETLPNPVDPAEEIAEGIVDEQAAANVEFAAGPQGDEPDNESDSVHEGLGEDTEGEATGGVDPAEEIAEGIVDEQAAANAPLDLSQQPQAETSRPQPLQQRRPQQRFARRRHYKIQEVIKRRQIILVQVVKEERGNKGAALTTYLSLAGRYCVLMPNTPRGGGISRKITSAADRKRLKGAVSGLELPEGMGLIIRTAGENRTKVEIKRDYEYLLRMWDTIRELTLKSNAPACVYEEGDLIKRAIRDLYNKDVTEIVVEGDDAYRNAKDFMRMLMPSHAKNVKPYKEAVPLFQRHHIEAQLDAMFQPTVTLKSGGYIVINQTEALVSIDVNSGRATREHSIEETAHKTNLEAADEVGRQLRLRDLAGLIVIDFIDMEDHRNDRNVEKRLYNAVKNDRARIQIGKISQFGLMEMSRQRLRAGVVAGSTVPCPHCGGQGIVRSVESTALRVLRGIEDEAQKLKATAVMVRVPADVALYTLNQKRRELARIENDYGMAVSFEPKDSILAGNFEIERTAHRGPDDKPPRIAVQVETALQPEAEEEEPEIVEEDEIEESVAEETVEVADEQPRRDDRQQSEQHGDGPRKRRRRGGRGRNRSSQNGGQTGVQAQGGQPNGDGNRERQQPVNGYSAETPDAASSDGGEIEQQDGAPQNAEQGGQQPQNGAPGEGGHRKRRRRRGRRGGGSNGPVPYPNEGVPVDASVREPVAPEDTFASEPETIAPNAASTPVWSLQPETPANGETQSAAVSPGAAVSRPDPVETAPVPVSPPQVDPDAPARKGWWQRTFNRSE